MFGDVPLRGYRIERPGWCLFDLQDSNTGFCAVHALNHIMQGEFPWFSVEDLREGARLATMADHEALVPPAEHSLPNGYFSSEAVGRGLGCRYFDMHGGHAHIGGLFSVFYTGAPVG